jgi:hypothetical protein
MREVSHEIGRKQLLSFMRFMVHLPSQRAKIQEIGNAYTTSMRTRVPGNAPRSPEVYYDGVIGIKHEDGQEITCYIESKAANHQTSIRKLPQHLRDFLVDAYCTVDAWSDNTENHKPIFLFLTNTPFHTSLMKNGKLITNEVRKILEQEITDVDSEHVEFLCNNLIVFFYINWLACGVTNGIRYCLRIA